MGRMRPECRVPQQVCVKPPLDDSGSGHDARLPHPRLQIPERPLDLGVEMPGPEFATDVREAKALDRFVETLPELAPVIGHQEPWFSPHCAR